MDQMPANQISEIELTIIAPMYNEESNIETTILAIQETMQAFPFPWEFILVNDGSIDNTLAVARDWEAKLDWLRVLSYPVNIGRGKALRTGFESARGKFVVTIDFDLSYSPDHIIKLFNELARDESIEIVLGSVYMKGGIVIGGRPLHIFLSKLGNKILEIAFNGQFKTTTCVLRGYRREALQALVLGTNRKEIHLEILSKAVALGLNIREIPATLRSRKRGASKTKLGRTSISHLLFSVYERPVLLFSAAGFVSVILGVIFGIYIAVIRFMGKLNPGRPLIDLVILLIVAGIQLLSFGIISGQNSFLRNEIFKLQSRIKHLERVGKSLEKDKEDLDK